MSIPTGPYLFHVNSCPTHVSHATFKKWYMTEHLPDLISSKIAIRALLYEEIKDARKGSPSNHPRPYLAYYETEFEELLKSPNMANVRATTELFKEEGISDLQLENGDFDPRNYKLVQVYNPKGNDEVAAPEIITEEFHPKDREGFDKWYREEHLEKLSKLPGFRRAKQYSLGPKTIATKGEDPPFYLTINEVDDAVKAFNSAEIAEAYSTSSAQKYGKESEQSSLRAWKLLHAMGF